MPRGRAPPPAARPTYWLLRPPPWPKALVARATPHAPPEHANNNMPGMHVGTQYFETDEKSMQFLQRFGVQHLDARVP